MIIEWIGNHFLRFWCKKAKRFENGLSNLAILILLLKKVGDQYRKRKYIQMETLSA